MTSATQVARYLQQQPLWGDTQLQKLVYYAQAWALAWTGRPLFDEDIEAWKLGPVTPSVWRLTSHGDLEFDPPQLTPSEKAIVDAIYAHYGSIGGRALSDLTHAEAPWKEAWATGKNTVIDRTLMRRTYVEQSLLGEGRVPVAPVLIGQPDASAVSAAVARQRKRWRPLLDRLANQ